MLSPDRAVQAGGSGSVVDAGDAFEPIVSCRAQGKVSALVFAVNRQCEGA
jgi:hypothetical protein